MGTNLKHESIHKITWLSSDQNTASQIDHMIIRVYAKKG